MVQKSQIVLSKMFTAQGMYNYSANSILSSAWCGVLACFEECDVEGVFVAVLFSGARDPFALPRSSLRILGSMIPHMWMISVHENFIFQSGYIQSGHILY